MSDTLTRQPAALSAEQHILNRHWQTCLVCVAEQQDREAFGELFDHFTPLLRAYSLRAQPGAYLLADELAQDVMIKVWNKASTYKPEMAAASTWIFTLARNSRIDNLRRNSRFVNHIEVEDLWQEPEDPAPSLFEAVQLKRSQKKVRQGLEQLPPEQRHVLAKVYLEGKSHQQAANELHLPLGTVKSRIRLALQKLKLLLIKDVTRP